MSLKYFLSAIGAKKRFMYFSMLVWHFYVHCSLSFLHAPTNATSIKLASWNPRLEKHGLADWLRPSLASGLSGNYGLERRKLPPKS